jgi:hypothetical protein
MLPPYSGSNNEGKKEASKKHAGGKMRFFDSEDGGIIFLPKHRRIFTAKHGLTSLKIMFLLIIFLVAQYIRR